MGPVTREKVSQLDQLKTFSKIVADSGDFESMRAYQPQDATTNPSLIFAAAQKPEYAAKTAEGIRKFAADIRELEKLVRHCQMS